MPNKTEKSEQEWQGCLSAEQYKVMRQHGTERPFTGKYADCKTAGTYVCAGCGEELFASETKFDSGTGWPSYYQAINEGADYIAFGRFFPSHTKPDAVAAELNLLERAKQELYIPVVAIGGITTENGGKLIQAGADMLAVVDGIFGQPDIEATARQYCSLFS